MKRYPEPSAENSFQLNEAALAADLEFPIAPDFISLPPQIDPQVMLARIEETMPWRSTQPGFDQRRLTEKVHEEFVL